jgi:SAM-dependent methyltransferase
MKGDFWDYSTEVYRRMKSPWRPSRQETAAMESLVAGWMRQRIDHSVIQMLVLGITPEIVNMVLPDKTTLTVVDNSEAMVRSFGPGDCDHGKHLVQADWVHLPFAPRRFDAIIGDGVFNIFSYPEGYRNFARILSSNLKPGGLFLTRLHAQSEPKENPQDVAALYLSAGITDYHELRYRFITAMQPDICQGVLSSKDIIDSQMVRFGISLPELYRRTGYTPPPEIKNLPVRTGAPPMKATYPTQSEFLDSVRGHFELLDVRYGDHALARQCPIFAFRLVTENKRVSRVHSSESQ